MANIGRTYSCKNLATKVEYVILLRNFLTTLELSITEFSIFSAASESHFIILLDFFLVHISFSLVIKAINVLGEKVRF